MQQRPTAAELLADISSLLTEVVDIVPDAVRHRVRVAANLAGIVEREVDLGPAAAEAERARLASLLDGSETADLTTLRAQLVDRLNAPAPLTQTESAAIYDVLLATVRDDLAISKPGYEQWTREET
jgi:Domain of unknown function (DUF6285)